TLTGASANMRLDGRNLTLGGTASTWSGGSINIDNGSTLTNALGSVLTATDNNLIGRFSFVGTAAFVNAGTFVKTTGVGNTSVSAAVTFTNTGTINVQTGSLNAAGGLTNTGTVTVSTGAVISGPVTSGTGGVVAGTGTYGPLTFNNGSMLSPGFSPGILTATG